MALLILPAALGGSEMSNWSEEMANLIAAAEWMRDFIEAVNEDRVSDNQRAQYERMMAFSGKSIAKALDFNEPLERLDV